MSDKSRTHALTIDISYVWPVPLPDKRSVPLPDNDKKGSGIEPQGTVFEPFSLFFSWMNQGPIRGNPMMDESD